MHIIDKRVDDWWEEPELKPRRVRVPRHLKHVDPSDPSYELPQRYEGTIGAFKPPHRWQYYSRIGGIDVGFLVPVYSLREIGQRYGLTHNSMTYFRRHILPEPFDIVRRRSTNAHHWSKFTLLALDVVLRHLHGLGYNQILSRYEDHVYLVKAGSDYITQYHIDRHEEKLHRQENKYGVSWFND